MKPSPITSKRKAKEALRAMQAQQRLRAKNPLRVQSGPVNSGYGNSLQAACTSGKSTCNSNIVLNRDYLTFVAQVGGGWRWVRVLDYAIDVMGSAYLFEETAAPELIQLWKRVVLDRAIPCNDGIMPETLRIVRHRIEMDDVTTALFDGTDNVDEIQRIMALSKLSDAEARLLGLSHQKAKQKLFQNPDFDRDDRDLLKGLAGCMAEFDLNYALRNSDLSDD